MRPLRHFWLEHWISTRMYTAVTTGRNIPAAGTDAARTSTVVREIIESVYGKKAL